MVKTDDHEGLEICKTLSHEPTKSLLLMVNVLSITMIAMSDLHFKFSMLYHSPACIPKILLSKGLSNHVKCNLNDDFGNLNKILEKKMNVKSKTFLTTKQII